MNLSQAQYDAIHITDQNLIVVAGAGSGKTSVLVQRYLHLLDINPDWALNSIVAITFTQKAAAEMRARVRDAIARRTDDPTLDQAARALWRANLNVIDSARIGTIHALCADILRANAAEATIDPDFAVLDEVSANLLIDDVLEDYLRALADKHAPALALFERDDAKNIRDALKATMNASAILPDVSVDSFALWNRIWVRDASDRWTALLEQSLFWQAVNWQPEQGFPDDSDDKLMDVWRACFPLFDILRAGDNIPACVEVLGTLNDVIKLTGGKAGLWGGKETLETAKVQLLLIRETAKTFYDAIGVMPGEIDQRAAVDVGLWHQLIAGAKAAYASAKRALSALDFDDLESGARDLLSTYPHVQARYRREFRHVLVDEFQDTNATQWQIVTALADQTRGGSLFLVGDPKQSIYAFRGADVSVFEATRAAFSATPVGREIVMTTSFRTHRTLVDGFNHLFTAILTREAASVAQLYQVRYDAMDAARELPPDMRPPIELVLYDKSALIEDDGEGFQARRWEAQTLARRVREIVEIECWQIYDRTKGDHRPIRYGDIALLFQAMTHAPLYEEALKDAELPYITVAGRGYYDRQEVWDVLHVLNALYNPSDELSLAGALRSPMFALSDNALFALRLLPPSVDDKPMSLIEALEYAAKTPGLVAPEEQTVIVFAWTCIRDLRRIAGRVTIADLLRAILDSTGYLAILTGLPDGTRRRGNVEKLIDKAETSGKIGLGAFTRYLTDLTDNETREGEAALDAEAAIQLMTVHKSKGLEFPLVVLVDCSYRWRANDQAALIIDPECGLTPKMTLNDGEPEKPYAYRRADTIRKAREDAEKRRLLYVAATRAQDYVLISGAFDFKKDGELSLDGWMRWFNQPFGLQSMTWNDGAETVYPWGSVRLYLPTVHVNTLTPTNDVFEDFEFNQQDDVLVPPLLGVVKIERDAAARSLSVTQIGDLGGAIFGSPDNQRPVYRERWLRGVFYQAPGHIETVSDHHTRATARRIGDMVHQVLRVRQPDDDRGEIKRLIESLAWEQGIVDPLEREQAVTRAADLLAKMRDTDVLAWIRESRQCYRELPFTFKTERRTIFGAMDVLIERADGNWAVIDFKTDTFRGEGIISLATFAEKARRYALQVGVYAAAVNELIGVVPKTYIHYIRYRQTVEIKTDEWQTQLARLEEYIGSLIQDDER